MTGYRTTEPPAGLRVTPWVADRAERARRRICTRLEGPSPGTGRSYLHNPEEVIAYVMAGHTTAEAGVRFGCHKDRACDYLRGVGAVYDRTHHRWYVPGQLEEPR